MIKIAIIGSGLSGLTAAYLLKDHADITVFEKARSVSGRMSSRRAEPYYFDHGAQYFTARTQPFKRFIQPLIDSGVIERWNARYVKLDGRKIIERKDWINDEPRYVGVPGMSMIAKYLATNLNIKLNAKIVTLRQEAKWQLISEKNISCGEFDWVICTAPSPQTADLMPKEFLYHDEIKAVQMRACFSLMLGFSQPLHLDFEAAHVINSDISWLAVNSHKPGRAEPYTLLVHSSEEYAQAHIDDNHDEVMQHLCSETSGIIGCDVGVSDYRTLHGWLYANNAYREKCPVFIDPRMQLGACGDWCLGGRVEGAYTAAYNLVENIKKIIP